MGIAAEDLFFRARIQETARQLGISVRPVAPEQLPQTLSHEKLSVVVLDLNHPAAIEVLGAIKNNPAISSVPILGFVSHVDKERAQAARAAGCDFVVARSHLSKRLAEVLRDFLKHPAKFNTCQVE